MSISSSVRNLANRAFPPTVRAVPPIAPAEGTPVEIGRAPEPVLLPDLAELKDVSQSFESKPATKVIEWAAERFGDGLVLAASFQDCVLIDLVSQVAPGTEVVFLDTQYHF